MANQWIDTLNQRFGSLPSELLYGLGTSEFINSSYLASPTVEKVLDDSKSYIAFYEVSYGYTFKASNLEKAVNGYGPLLTFKLNPTFGLVEMRYNFRPIKAVESKERYNTYFINRDITSGLQKLDSNGNIVALEKNDLPIGILASNLIYQSDSGSDYVLPYHIGVKELVGDILSAEKERDTVGNGLLLAAKGVDRVPFIIGKAPKYPDDIIVGNLYLWTKDLDTNGRLYFSKERLIKIGEGVKRIYKKNQLNITYKIISKDVASTIKLGIHDNILEIRKATRENENNSDFLGDTPLFNYKFAYINERAIKAKNNIYADFPNGSVEREAYYSDTIDIDYQLSYIASHELLHQILNNIFKYISVKTWEYESGHTDSIDYNSFILPKPYLRSLFINLNTDASKINIPISESKELRQSETILDFQKKNILKFSTK